MRAFSGECIYIYIYCRSHAYREQSFRCGLAKEVIHSGGDLFNRVDIAHCVSYSFEIIKASKEIFS